MYQDEEALFREQNHKYWRAVTAKLGHANAAEVRPGGTLQECHEQRKKVRQAVNAITIDQGSREPTTEEIGAMHHASTLVAKLNSMIDRFENDKGSSNISRQSVMRNAADYRRHYQRGESGFGQEAIGIDEFFRGVANLPTTTAVRNALSVGTNTAGGFAVPAIMMPGILESMASNSALLQAGMGVVDLSEMDGKNFTSAAIDNIPTAAWRAENGAVAESDPSFRAVVATPRSLAFFFRVSRELLADAPNMQEALLQAIGQAFAKAIDRTGLRGTGTAPQPMGLLPHPDVHKYLYDVGDPGNGMFFSSTAPLLRASEMIVAADGPLPTAAIFSPREYLFMTGGWTDTDGNARVVPKLFENWNMLYSNQIPIDLEVGTSDDCSEIYVGDFTRMNLMLREAVSVQLLTERYAEVGQIGFMCHVRADFAVNYPKAFAVITGVRGRDAGALQALSFFAPNT